MRNEREEVEGRTPAGTGSREPSPSASALTGFDPLRIADALARSGQIGREAVGDKNRRLAVADAKRVIEAELIAIASETEARRAEPQGGSVEDEGSVPEGQTPHSSPDDVESLCKRLEKDAHDRVKAERMFTDLRWGENYDSVKVENTVQWQAAFTLRSIVAERDEWEQAAQVEASARREAWAEAEARKDAARDVYEALYSSYLDMKDRAEAAEAALSEAKAEVERKERGIWEMAERNAWLRAALSSAKAEAERLKKLVTEGSWETVESEQAWKRRAEAAEAALKPFAEFIAGTDPAWADNRRISTLLIPSLRKGRRGRGEKGPAAACRSHS